MEELHPTTIIMESCIPSIIIMEELHPTTARIWPHKGPGADLVALMNLI
jgi:hypothetical protein